MNPDQTASKGGSSLIWVHIASKVHQQMTEQAAIVVIAGKGLVYVLP